jgi:LacI family transcriptional regulator
MDRRPTIIDVAREAGVSKSTVSLVLQNSSQVRHETRNLVRETMAKIGYVYNRSAANLRAANVGLIGLVINDLRNPFFTEFATSLQMALSTQGYATVVANTDEDPQLQSQVVAAMIEHGVSALVISPAYGGGSDAFDALQRAGIPAMQVLRKVDPRTGIFPFAAPDYLAGSKLATRHLFDSGARRIAFVGGLEGRSVTQERREGYFEVLSQHGLEPLTLAGRASRAFGREVAHKITREHPLVDSAVCFNDLVALGMLTGFAELGRRVGEDFRIVGFDDIEDCAQSFPALTSVHCDIANLGLRMASTTIDWLEEGIIPPPETRTPVELIVRKSSGSRLSV